MRILHIITRLIRGGAQQNTVISCAGQVARGHEVYLAYGPIYGPEGTLEDEARAAGAKLIVVPAMRRAILPGHDYFTYRALRKIIREIKPDIVHTHSSKAGIVGRAAAWAEKVPGVVHTIHGLPFHDRQLKIVHGIYVMTERWAAKRCHKLVGITQAMGDEFAKYKISESEPGRPGPGLPAPGSEKFCVVPSGIEFSKLGLPADINTALASPLINTTIRQQIRSELSIPNTAPVICIVARLDHLKGHDDLLDIFPKLLAKNSETRLLFVGDGWHKAALQSRITQEHFENRVHITGVVPLQRVAQILQASDIMALPSYQEGQGRALVEALACGCAIVGYRVGGIPEVCIDNVTGKLAPMGDRNALFKAVSSLLDDDVLRQQLTTAGRKLAYEKFSAQSMVEGLERVYSDLIKNQQPSGATWRGR